jgi:protein TonB
MDWRKTSDEETEELRQFVEDMKRGRTPATRDSLLETLRQIHDKREAPAPAHEHRQMLLGRLRREMAARSGASPGDTLPALFLSREPKPRRALRWALAASIVVHVAAGAAVLTTLRFGPSVIAGVLAGNSPREEMTYLGTRTWLSPSMPARTSGSPDAKRPNAQRADRVDGRGAGGGRPGELAREVLWRAASGVEPSAARAVAGPRRPVIGSASPMLDMLAPGADALAEEGFAGRGGDKNLSGPSGPDPSVAPSPWSEVLADSYEHDESGIVPHKLIFTPKPVYTDEGIEGRVQGVVKISAVLAANGTVQEVRVVRSLGHGLDEAAIQAVRNTKFDPATRGGVRIPVTVTFNVTFTLR